MQRRELSKPLSYASSSGKRDMQTLGFSGLLLWCLDVSWLAAVTQRLAPRAVLRPTAFLYGLSVESFLPTCPSFLWFSLSLSLPLGVLASSPSPIL